MLLKNVRILKYKSIEVPQVFEVDPLITILVGMNESGKTSVLECIAKTNYFQDDDDFMFSVTRDYPRKEKKKLDKSGEDPSAIICTYTLSSHELADLASKYGDNTLNGTDFHITYSYSGKQTWSYDGLNFSNESFWKHQLSNLGISNKSVTSKLVQAKSLEDLNKVAKEYATDENKEAILSLNSFLLMDGIGETPLLRIYVAQKLSLGCLNFCTTMSIMH